MAHSMDSINDVSCCSSLTPVQRILSSCPSLTPFVAKWTLRWNLIRGSEIALGLGARLARPFGCLLKVFHSIILGRIKTQLTRECWLLLVSGSGYVSVSGSRSASVCVSLSWQWGLRPGAVTASKEVGKEEGALSAWLAIKCRKNHKIIVNVERISHYTQGAGACCCPRQVLCGGGAEKEWKGEKVGEERAGSGK